MAHTWESSQVRIDAEVAANLSMDELRAMGYCGKLMADGVHRCRNFSGARTKHPHYGPCKYHGGNRESDRMVSAKEELEDRSYTLSVEIEPTDALRQALYMAAGAVAYCQLKIRALEEDSTELEYDEMGYHATANSRMLATWMTLYAKEREAMTAIAEKCLKAGIAERHVRAVEHRAGLLGDALGKTLAESSLDAAQQRELVEGLRRNLATMVALEATTTDGKPAHRSLPTKKERALAQKADDEAATPADYPPGTDGIG